MLCNLRFPSWIWHCNPPSYSVGCAQQHPFKTTAETIKLLEENIGKTLSDIHHSRILYDPPPRILEIKAKINKWDLIKLKSFCTSKEMISKVKPLFFKSVTSFINNYRQKEVIPWRASWYFFFTPLRCLEYDVSLKVIHGVKSSNLEFILSLCGFIVTQKINGSWIFYF